MGSPKRCTNKTNRVLLQQFTNHTIRDYVNNNDNDNDNEIILLT